MPSRDAEGDQHPVPDDEAVPGRRVLVFRGTSGFQPEMSLPLKSEVTRSGTMAGPGVGWAAAGAADARAASRIRSLTGQLRVSTLEAVIHFRPSFSETVPVTVTSFFSMQTSPTASPAALLAR